MAAEEALISVPIEHTGWLTRALRSAGLTVLDTGERVTTEERLEGEAVLCIAALCGSPPEAMAFPSA